MQCQWVEMSSVDELLELNPSPKSEWKDSEYAVYFYTPNRARRRNEGRTAGAGFSLTLVGSSISPDREHLLREQVATKMSQGSLYIGSGQVTTLDPDLFPPPSQSYYCLLEVNSRPTSPATDRGGEGLIKQFLVCFVAIGKQGLDLFRNELDSYCEELLPLLQELPKEESPEAFLGSKVEDKIKNWFSENVTYLTRVVQRCHQQLPAFLHTVVNSRVEVSGDKESVKDVRQFLEACSLANLMQFDTKKGDVTDGLAEEVKSSPGELPSSPVHIQVTKDGCSMSSDGIERMVEMDVGTLGRRTAPESSKFCSNWAQVLLAQGTSSPDPFFLRQAVENYKLKIIQDINALKRLLRQAETDYHALYRCYVFLCACGNGKLLLQCATQEAKCLPSPETLSVLKALQIYTDKCGFRNIRT